MNNSQGYKQTDIWETPDEWEVISLSGGAYFINGFPFKPSDWKKSGLPIVRIQNLNNFSAQFNYYDGEIGEEYILKDGDLLLSWSASLGVYIWNRGKAVLNQHIFKVVPYDKVDKLFLYYIAHKAVEDLKKRVHGSTMRHFKKRELDATLILLPPLPEQWKIASILSTVDDAIQKTDEIIAKTQQLKKGLMQQLLTKGIGHTKFKRTEIGEIPEDWYVEKLANLLDEPIKNGYSPRSPLFETGKWILTLGALTNDGLKTDRIKSAPLNDSKVDKCKLKEDDLLISRSNTRELVGYAALYHGIPTNCSYPDLMMRIRVNKTIINNSFLEYWLRHSYSRRYLTSNARGTSGTMVKINRSILSELLIPIPPLSEQKDISARLKTLDEKATSEKWLKEKLECLKKGLMQVLLTGKVRVKVN